MTDADDEDAYDGLSGTFPYAFRRTESSIFRAYVLLGGLLAALLTLLFTFALVVQIANTLGGTGGTFTFSRSFFLFVGLLVVAPLLGPVLFVARRHRRVGSDGRYDLAMALLGFGFAVSLYLAAVASMPECFTIDGQQSCRPAPSGPFAPLVGALYAMPPASSPLIPLVVAVAMFCLDRKWEDLSRVLGRA